MLFFAMCRNAKKQSLNRKNFEGVARSRKIQWEYRILLKNNLQLLYYSMRAAYTLLKDLILVKNDEVYRLFIPSWSHKKFVFTFTNILVKENRQRLLIHAPYRSGWKGHENFVFLKKYVQHQNMQAIFLRQSPKTCFCNPRYFLKAWWTSVEMFWTSRWSILCRLYDQWWLLFPPAR